jgi:hypothetical protein
MKLRVFCIAAICCLPFPAIAADEDSRAELGRVEALQNRKNEDRRQHFLYDTENQPGNQPETTGSAFSAKDCKNERVRVLRGDGTTTVTRSRKCR